DAKLVADARVAFEPAQMQEAAIDGDDAPDLAHGGEGADFGSEAGQIGDGHFGFSKTLLKTVSKGFGVKP
ncbi:MAG: hypothetical protein KDI74_18650, partial [Gammaproteobacteria bacterium]|nr:hypothetical protein [Gammaproteobacteria bacterium]